MHIGVRALKEVHVALETLSRGMYWCSERIAGNTEPLHSAQQHLHDKNVIYMQHIRNTFMTCNHFPMVRSAGTHC